MPEENVATTPAPEQQQAQTPAQPDINQFAENIWNDTQQQAPAAQQTPPQTPVVEQPKPEETFVEANEYLKQQLGFDDWAKAKEEIEALRKLREQAQTPAEIKFANDQSKQFFDLLKEGKEDDVYNVLHQKKQLDRLEKLELTSAKEAADIIKANLQFKHKDLQPHEIERIFNRQYATPPQPKQGDMDDAEYGLVLDHWKAQVAEKEQDMIIDAKLAKPELSKFKSELVLPDIPKPQTTQQGPSQEELAAYEQYKTGAREVINADFKNFNGFNVTYKDKEVEIPITYAIDDNEKAALKESVLKDVLGDHFNVNEFFGNRWFDKEGKPNTQLIMSDLYWLTNRDKVIQKITNDAGSKRLEHHIKTQSKITVNGLQSQTVFDPNSREKQMDELANAAFQ